jgi:hypothetical protein
LVSCAAQFVRQFLKLTSNHVDLGAQDQFGDTALHHALKVLVCCCCWWCCCLFSNLVYSCTCCQVALRDCTLVNAHACGIIHARTHVTDMLCVSQYACPHSQRDVSAVRFPFRSIEFVRSLSITRFTASCFVYVCVLCVCVCVCVYTTSAYLQLLCTRGTGELPAVFLPGARRLCSGRASQL